MPISITRTRTRTRARTRTRTRISIRDHKFRQLYDIDVYGESHCSSSDGPINSSRSFVYVYVYRFAGYVVRSWANFPAPYTYPCPYPTPISIQNHFPMIIFVNMETSLITRFFPS